MWKIDGGCLAKNLSLSDGPNLPPTAVLRKAHFAFVSCKGINLDLQSCLRPSCQVSFFPLGFGTSLQRNKASEWRKGRADLEMDQELFYPLR